MASNKGDDKQNCERVVGEYRVTVHPRLGKGTFGIVYKAFHKREKRMYAVKEIGYKELTMKEKTELFELVKLELDTLSKVQDHPNIVKLKEYFDFEESYWMVMEHCDKGDLKQYLEQNQQLSIQELLVFMQQLSTALCYMHSQKPAIVHRDIKLHNILVKTEGGKVMAKLCDFGFAKFHERYSTMSAAFKYAAFMHSVKGSPPFMAPEFSAKLEGGTQYTTAADVFSLGLVFQVMLSPDRTDYRPISVEARAKGDDINIGLEMVKRYKARKTLPTVIETHGGDDNLTKNAKRVIRHMTSFHYVDRRCMADVAEELTDLVEGLEGSAKDEDQKSSFDKSLHELPLPKTDSGHKVMADLHYTAAAAIEIRPMFSIYGVSFKYNENDIKVPIKWGSRVAAHPLQAPTSLLGDNNGKFLDEARETVFTKPSNPDKGYLFKRFDIGSYSGEIKDAMLTSTDGKHKLPAIEVFSMALKYIKDHLLRNISEPLCEEVNTRVIRWVLTVPSNSSDAKKLFMREAAVKGGLVDNIESGNLMIALESKAASLYCRSREVCKIVGEKIADNIQISQGEIFMLVDAREKSTEITVHEMQADNNTKLLHLCGSPLGSIHVDEQLHHLFDEAFGVDIMAEFKPIHPNHWESMILDWEMKKENMTRMKSTVLSLNSVFANFMAKSCNGHDVRRILSNKPECGMSLAIGFLRISASKMQSMFDYVIDVARHLKNVKCIDLVGVFAEAKLLQEQMKEKFSSSVRSVLIPEDASLCVIKGAVLYGHRSSTI